MNIEERIKATLAQARIGKKTHNLKIYGNLRDFYEAKKKEGVVVKQEYKLPPLDTIGRSLLEPARSENSASEKLAKPQ